MRSLRSPRGEVTFRLLTLVMLFLATVFLFWLFLRAHEKDALSITGISLTAPCDEGQYIVADENSNRYKCAYPPLKELLEQLDTLACRMHLQYSIDNQYPNPGNSIFVGFAWPEHMNWLDAVQSIEDGGVATYQASGFPNHYRTREAAAVGLMGLLKSGRPNIQAYHRTYYLEPGVHLAPSITGPKCCKRTGGK